MIREPKLITSESAMTALLNHLRLPLLAFRKCSLVRRASLRKLKMRNCSGLCFAALAAWLLAWSPVHAQKFNFRHIGVQEGLPQSQVNAIYQDQTGYIWAGTLSGLSRFDGEEFKHYSVEHGLVHNEVRAIAGFQHELLIGGKHGLSILQRDSFIKYPRDSLYGAEEVTCFLEEGDRTLIGTEYGIRFYDGQKIQPLSIGEALDTLQIKQFLRDREGRYWVATTSGGLWRTADETLTLGWIKIHEESGLPTDRIAGVAQDKEGRIWVGTVGQGLYNWDGGLFQSVRMPEYIEGSFVSNMISDEAGCIWIGLWGEGLIRYDGSIFSHFHDENGLRDNVVASLCSDAEGNLWVGSLTRGFSMFLGDEFKWYGEDSGLPDINVRAIAEDAEGSLWVSTLGGVAKISGPDVVTYGPEQGINSKRLGPLAIDDQGQLTVGAFDGTIYRFDGQQYNAVPDPDTLINSEVMVLERADGHLWIGTYRGDLLFMKNGVLSKVPNASGLQSRNLWSLHEDADKTLWIGTDNGVFTYEDGVLSKFYERNTNVSEDAVYKITSDERYHYFATGNHGLWRYHDKDDKWGYLDQKMGLSGNQFKAVVWMEPDQLMATSVQGMDKVEFMQDTLLVRHFERRTLPEHGEFNPGAAYVDQDGQVWLGTNTGVLVYDGAREVRNPESPRTALQYVHLFNQAVDWRVRTDSMDESNNLPVNPHLSYQENHITIGYAGIQYAALGNMHYRYRLVNFDDDWRVGGNRREAVYSNLAAGEYIFEVQTANHHNLWSAPARFHFFVDPPYWQTWWFYVALLVAVLFFGYLIGRAYKVYRKEYVSGNTSGSYVQKSGRLLLLLGWLVYPVVGWLLISTGADLNLPATQFLAVGLIFLAAYLTTFFQGSAKRRVDVLTRSMLYIITAHLLYLLYINKVDPILLAILLTFFGTGAIVFHRLQGLTYFSAFVVAGTFGLILLVQEPRINVVVLAVLVVMTLLIVFAGLTVRLNLSHRLLFSDKIINSTRSLVIAADRNGTIIHISPNVKELLGYDESEVLGDGWWQVRAADDPEGAAEMRKGLSDKTSETRTSFASYQTSVRTKDGELRWFQWEDNFLPNGMTVGIGQDVTESRQLNKELEKLSMVASKTNNFVIITDTDNRISWVNQGFTNLYRYKLEEVLGHKPQNMLTGPNSDLEALKVMNDLVYQQGKPYQGELQVYGRNGHTFWASMSITPVKDASGEIIQYFAVGSDISDEVESRNKLREYTAMIEQKNKDINDSINYAQRIQMAMIPSSDQIAETLADSFVLFQPRDKLSGDFYYVEEKDGIKYVAVVDCTGHSVPGALISLIGYTLLNQAIFEKDISDPSEILNFLDKGVKDVFGHYTPDQMITDGMDISLCAIDPKEKQLRFAGAMSPLWVYRSGDWHALSGVRLSIGYSVLPTARQFETEVFPLEDGDMMYMFSDGFCDQFGGESAKKYGVKRFRQKLEEIQSLPLTQQRLMLQDEIVTWMADQEQTDDITVMGFRIG